MPIQQLVMALLIAQINERDMKIKYLKNGHASHIDCNWQGRVPVASERV
jgi:hypothetical protein